MVRKVKEITIGITTEKKHALLACADDAVILGQNQQETTLEIIVQNRKIGFRIYEGKTKRVLVKRKIRLDQQQEIQKRI